jgi:hypothetical protein
MDDDFNINIEQENQAQIEPILIDDDKHDEKKNDRSDTEHSCIIEEKYLSQKLSQLSTVTTTSTINKRSPCKSPSTITTVLPKKLKIETTEESHSKKLPYYLSVENKAFNQMIQSMISNTANPFSIEDLREIAFLMHQIATLELQQSLWSVYLQSGTGRLEQNQQAANSNIHLYLWPSEVKEIMIKKCEISTTNINQIKDDDCATFVSRTLRQFIDLKIQYEKQLNEKKCRLSNVFTSTMEDTIDDFIEQQEIIFQRIPIQSKINIVKYDYKDRLLELEFEQLQPVEQQVRLVLFSPLK